MKRPFVAGLLIAAAALTTSTWSQATPPAPAAPAAAPAMPAAVATPAEAKKARIAVFKLSQTLTERPQSFGLSLSTLLSGGAANGPALSDLILHMTQAAYDPDIKGVYIDLSSFSLDLNQAQEIGQLMTTCRNRQKFVALYSSDFDTPTYLLASYAQKIIMPENGDLMIPGTGMEMVFFAGTLEKLNMSADFVQVGKFKGAEEPFTRKTASPEYRQQIEKLADGMYQQLITTIATNRPNLSEDQVKKLIDQGWFTGRGGKAAGLIDETRPRDKVEDYLAGQFPAGVELVDDYGEVKKKPIDLSSPLAILSLLGSDNAKPKSDDPAIAVLYANGEIAGDSAGSDAITDGVTPSMVRKALKTALEDDHVKAIVLRVDSPGGSAAASDEIWSMLKDADKKKPVTVSMGHMAASGGYFISCAGRSIMADPATITGSIGVVSGKVVIKGALDWAGLNIEPVTRGAHAEMNSMLRPFTDEERTFLQKQSEEIYGVFTKRVSDARGDKVAKLDEVAQGRLFTGQQAKAVGLVDSVGTLNDAVIAAAKSANISHSYQIIVLPEARSFADILRDGLASEAAPQLIEGVRIETLNALLDPLPSEVRAATLQALHMTKTLNAEHVLMALPPGLIEKK